ncbi:L-threonylcarbamoyladenylate synthase [Pseudomarimonas arenosa]|uniref:Threonylcarbamoyl-AMP synthase n=1 Tax=Pseudomarimonas arenosa TaxID=2774145 RepID=A0AAW3ZDD7_9GAMM|nr:L-threonylcarbamoyladenylate synthase [Pseudomarimonas arenosa]MBD8524238.1 threonylcarbamoyl-AMP synthase [Pseudomarimonas arenosa]
MDDPALTAAESAQLDAAVAALQRGECIGLPTETVYGLAADALNRDAVRRIFALKGRPADHPVIVHLPDAGSLTRYAREVPPAALVLAGKFWPGPLTLILKRHPKVPDEITGGQDTVGIRVPAHRLARALLQRFGRGLAAPSANRFGRISPTTAAHVRSEFGDQVPLVLDGGACQVGIESTIVDLSGGTPRVLRPGMISSAQIEAALADLGTPVIGSANAQIRAPGLLEKHYAPRTAMRLSSRAALAAPSAHRCVLALGTLPEGHIGLALPNEPVGYAKGLYAALRTLDESGASLIEVESPPDEDAWRAIHDRLKRAAAGSSQH